MFWFFQPTPPPPTPIPVIEYKEQFWKCPTCTPAEQYVLKELQKQTNIKSRNALSAILGNIKQESNFRSFVCEGGSRVPYDRCHRGGLWNHPVDH